jgi:iron complex transport system ATP-binding protein
LVSSKSSTEPPPALGIRDLSLSIGGSDILKGVSFDIPRGAFVSIVGPNGAGKTTLLRCVMSIVTGWTGNIFVEGKPVHAYRPRELARLVSYVPQWDNMVFPFTGRELVMMGRYPYLSPFIQPDRKDLDVVEHTLQSTGTQSIADRDMRTLSGGEKQKILIAGALAQEAGTMLLDEPTTFLDPLHAEEVLSILNDLNRSGVTVVIITHDINHAAYYADSITALVEGRVVFYGPPEDLLVSDMLRSVYNKDFILVKHPVSGKTMTLPGERRS